MEKLIVIWQKSDFYHTDMPTPVLYESPERFLSDFAAAIRAGVAAREPEIKFAGVEWVCDDFYYNNDVIMYPDVFTVDEWFETFVPK